jgi:ubiquinone/menaquinone biosynthesis C-methylase UbiE
MPSSKISKSYWLKISENWKKVLPPIRPSNADIKTYATLIKKHSGKRKNLKILILGSTPELRDLAHKLCAETTVADMSSDMIMSMSELMKQKKGIDEEFWIKGSWVNVPLAENYFDAILGDAVSSNMPWKLADDWMHHMTKLLKKDGIFIERAFIYTGHEDIKTLLQKLIKNIVIRKSVTYSDFSLMQTLLICLSYSKEKTVVNNESKKNLAKFKAEYGEKFINSLYQKFDKVFPSNPPKSWRSLNENEQDKDFGKFFKITGKGLSKSFVKNYMFYSLKKK